MDILAIARGHPELGAPRQYILPAASIEREIASGRINATLDDGPLAPLWIAIWMVSCTPTWAQTLPDEEVET
ncbi:hypothetical protein DL771_007918 [Monosporascus sp. 5C6A]|nr:hypothetical protein DL771_007918 [Monosporascus sp. 5C6A]